MTRLAARLNADKDGVETKREIDLTIVRVSDLKGLLEDMKSLQAVGPDDSKFISVVLDANLKMWEFVSEAAKSKTTAAGGIRLIDAADRALKAFTEETLSDERLCGVALTSVFNNDEAAPTRKIEIFKFLEDAKELVAKATSDYINNDIVVQLKAKHAELETSLKTNKDESVDSHLVGCKDLDVSAHAKLISAAIDGIEVMHGLIRSFKKGCEHYQEAKRNVMNGKAVQLLEDINVDMNVAHITLHARKPLASKSE